MLKFKKIGCAVDETSKRAVNSYNKLITKYNFVNVDNIDPNDLDLIIVLGGDGFMLKVMHKYIKFSIPIYGMNRGTIGFLLNKYSFNNIYNKLSKAISYTLFPLEMYVKTTSSETYTQLAINEVSLLRQTNQAAKLRISIDDSERIKSLICDGIIVSTAAGSTAYNFAANGPIIPLGSNILAMTPISPFRPRRWRGALLSHENKVRINIIESQKRPVSAVADFNEIRNVTSVEIYERRDLPLNILFDQKNNIQDRIIKEQFLT